MFNNPKAKASQSRQWVHHGDATGLRTCEPLNNLLAALLGPFARSARDPGAYAGVVHPLEHPVEFTRPTCDPHVVKTTAYAVHANRVPWPDFCEVAAGRGYAGGEHFLAAMASAPTDWRRP